MYKFFPILLFAYGLGGTIDEIYDNSYALVIGINKYHNVQSLHYAVKDAESIQDILKNTYDFPAGNITLLINEDATKQSILQAFSDITTKAEEKDRVLIYFAGHGETMDLPDGGEMGYLLPVDGNDENLYMSSIGMDELKKISLMSKAKHLLYLVDACYGGIATIGSRGLDSKTTSNYIEKITRNKSRQIITAGGKDELVLEKPEWGSSAFTLNLKRGLKDGNADMNADGYITAAELGIYLNEKVTIDSENQQTPQYGRMTSQDGEFVFVYSENTVVIQDQSTDEKLDLVLSEIEKLKSKKYISNVELEDKIPDINIEGTDLKIKIPSKFLEINTDGNNVKIGLDGITIKDHKGEEIQISSGAILGGLIIVLIVIIIIVVIFGNFLSSLLRSIFVILGKLLRSLLKIIIIHPIKLLLKKGRK